MSIPRPTVTIQFHQGRAHIHITGPQGCGKTQLAHDIKRQFTRLKYDSTVVEGEDGTATVALATFGLSKSQVEHIITKAQRPLQAVN